MKGYRTLLVNTLPMVTLITDYFVNDAALFRLLIEDPKDAALAIAGINVLNIILRFLTTTAVGNKC